MTTSKDSQFLEVCKKPILTDLPVLIKTWIEIGSYSLSFEIISVGAFELSPDSLLTLGEHFIGYQNINKYGNRLNNCRMSVFLLSAYWFAFAVSNAI